MMSPATSSDVVRESTLAIIPGANDHQRLVVILRSLEQPELETLEVGNEVSNAHDTDRAATLFCQQVQMVTERPIVLRQESFSAAVGWFTQSSLEMTLPQWQAMRCTMLPRSVVSTRPRPSNPGNAQADDDAPQIVPFTAASA